MNPQFAPYLIQQANAPAQAKYQQQQAAFEAAMQGQQHALAAGTQLIGQGSKEDIARMMEQGRQGQDAISNQLRMLGLQIQQQNADTSKAKADKPPAPGYQIVYDLQGNAYWAPKPTAPTAVGQGAATSPSAQPVMLPSGAQAGKPATEKEAESAAAMGVFRKTMDQLKEIIDRRIVPGTTVERGIERVASYVPGTESSSEMSDVNIYNARRNDLGTLARTLYNATGIRAYQEVLRLINNIPPFTASPELAKKAMGQIEDAWNTAESERQRLRPQVFGSSPTGQPAAPGGQRKTAAQLADEMGLK
jgi:hypothetical protein